MEILFYENFTINSVNFRQGQITHRNVFSQTFTFTSLKKVKVKVGSYVVCVIYNISNLVNGFLHVKSKSDSVIFFFSTV